MMSGIIPRTGGYRRIDIGLHGRGGDDRKSSWEVPGRRTSRFRNTFRNRRRRGRWCRNHVTERINAEQEYRQRKSRSDSPGSRQKAPAISSGPCSRHHGIAHRLGPPPARDAVRRTL